MDELTALKSRHARALAAAGEVVAQVERADLSRPTPCQEWDLGALLAHMIGQNHGFAMALEVGDAPLSAFAAPALGPDPAQLVPLWAESAVHVGAAVARAGADHRVRLVELATDRRFSGPVAVGFHLLDTVVHGWDVARALGLDRRPDDDLVEATYQLAVRVPTGEARRRADAAFAPVLDIAAQDDWHRTLALLGRDSR